MLKETITYTDFNGVERTEDFYFHISKQEAIELELSYPGGFANKIRRIIALQDTVELSKIFKDLILRAYGEKSDDGKRFVKSQELTTAFTQTDAFSIFYINLISNEDKAVEFVNNVLPSDIKQQK